MRRQGSFAFLRGSNPRAPAGWLRPRTPRRGVPLGFVAFAIVLFAGSCSPQLSAPSTVRACGGAFLVSSPPRSSRPSWSRPIGFSPLSPTPRSCPPRSVLRSAALPSLLRWSVRGDVAALCRSVTASPAGLSWSLLQLFQRLSSVPPPPLRLRCLSPASHRSRGLRAPVGLRAGRCLPSALRIPSLVFPILGGAGSCASSRLFLRWVSCGQFACFCHGGMGGNDLA
jgi:hypothetical protein